MSEYEVRRIILTRANGFHVLFSADQTFILIIFPFPFPFFFFCVKKNQKKKKKLEVPVDFYFIRKKLISLNMPGFLMEQNPKFGAIA